MVTHQSPSFDTRYDDVPVQTKVLHRSGSVVFLHARFAGLLNRHKRTITVIVTVRQVLIVVLLAFAFPLGVRDIPPYDALDSIGADNDVSLGRRAIFEVYDMFVQACLRVRRRRAGDVHTAFVEVRDFGVDVLHEAVEELGAMNPECVVLLIISKLRQD